MIAKNKVKKMIFQVIEIKKVIGKVVMRKEVWENNQFPCGKNIW